MILSALRRLRAARVWLPAVAGLAALALIAAGCGGSTSSSGSSGSSASSGKAYGGGASAPANAAPKTAASKSGTTSVALGSTKLGKILVDGQGRTLYLFQADKGTSSMCSGACTSEWPPLTTKGQPVAATGVSGTKLGTTKRSDGTVEVTYNGHPLYTFVGDQARGQTSGEEIHDFGAEWDVLSAAGEKVTLDSK